MFGLVMSRYNYGAATQAGTNGLLPGIHGTMPGSPGATWTRDESRLNGNHKGGPGAASLAKRLDPRAARRKGLDPRGSRGKDWDPPGNPPGAGGKESEQRENPRTRCSGPPPVPKSRGSRGDKAREWNFQERLSVPRNMNWKGNARGGKQADGRCTLV
ncbi:hypothetical protein OS493_009886 [Desmophyllum pertusum]|uniref:Uncharacterized protein n=1 Tax=Desmophyllum pertusum TaxID=174260 RepID=A0A9W9YHA9_9CNID|nr:hypothetical protein OS493_009886 [Desmophyllum pertusum]